LTDTESVSEKESAMSETSKLLCGATLAIAFAASTSFAAVDPPNAKDLTQGNWELNLTKSKFCNAAPQKGARQIFDSGWGLIVVEQTGVNAKGESTVGRYVYRYDGDKYPDNITRPAREAITWKQVGADRVEFVHWDKQDKLTSEYVRTVTADGQSMTQTGKFVGRECIDSQVFDRVK
jgi:hypothetical protein